MRGEQLGEHVRHRAPVLYHVGDTRRDAQVVLEHAHLPGAVAHEVDTRNVHAYPTGRRHTAACGAVVVGRGDDQPPGDDPGAHDLARSVHVVEKPFQGAHPLRDTPLDERPLVRGDDPRDEVERKRSLLTGMGVGDALIAKDPVARRAALVEVLLRKGLYVFVE